LERRHGDRRHRHKLEAATRLLDDFLRAARTVLDLDARNARRPVAPTPALGAGRRRSLPEKPAHHLVLAAPPHVAAGAGIYALRGLGVCDCRLDTLVGGQPHRAAARIPACRHADSARLYRPAAGLDLPGAICRQRAHRPALRKQTGRGALLGYLVSAGVLDAEPVHHARQFCARRTARVSPDRGIAPPEAQP